MAIATARKRDPLLNFRFKVIIDGYKPIGFMNISGLEKEAAVAEYREGEEPPFLRKIPGITTFTDLSASRGLDPDNTLSLISESVSLVDGPNFGEGKGDPEYRFNMTVFLYDKDRNVAKKWRVYNCWMRLYGIEEFDATSQNQVAMEKAEFVHEGFKQIR